MRHLLYGIFVSAFFALVYGVTFRVQFLLLTDLNHVQGISWFFLPAGIKLLAFMVGGWWGLLGVAFTGAVTADEVWGGLWLEHLGNALVWALVPFVVYRSLVKVLRIDPDFLTLTYYKVIIIALVVALVSSVSSVLYYSAVGNRTTDNMVADAMAMALGDFMGMTFVLSVCVFALRWVVRRQPNTRGDL
ncbi:MAG: hypothetical protein RLZZ397_1137 [Pseudomonadota bacterium]|jgi:hypothetical protein